MLEQIGNTLTFYAFYTASKVGKTGLTVTVNVRRGTTSVVTGGSATEIGDGLYAYTLASGSVTAENEYTAVFKTSDTSVDQQDIPALWAVGRAGIEDLDAAISTRLASSSYSAPPNAASVADAIWDEAISGHLTVGSTGAQLNAAGASGDPWATDLTIGGYSGDQAGKYLSDARNKTQLITAENVAFTNPTNPITGDLAIVRGDDYTAATGRALPEWSSDDWTPFDLTTAQSVTFKARTRYSESAFEQVATVLSATQVRVEFTSAQTGAFAAGRDVYSFDLEAVLAGGEIVTLAQGMISVIEDVE